MDTSEDDWGRGTGRVHGDAAGHADVREARCADAAGVARVHVESWRTTYRGIVPDDFLAGLSVEQRERHWARVLCGAGGGEFVYVAEEDGQIVGFASGGPERSGDPIHKGELYAIYVLNTHQRRGLGRSLTRAVAERLARGGMRSMLVWVLAANPWRRFYEALGGRQVYVKPVEIGGITLDEVAYGWTDVTRLVEAAGYHSRDQGAIR